MRKRSISIEVNYFKTASYGHYKAENVLGKVLKGIPRGRYCISTKVGRYGSYGINTWDYSAGRARESVFESMERLGIDYIDLTLPPPCFRPQIRITSE